MISSLKGPDKICLAGTGPCGVPGVSEGGCWDTQGSITPLPPPQLSRGCQQLCLGCLVPLPQGGGGSDPGVTDVTWVGGSGCTATALWRTRGSENVGDVEFGKGGSQNPSLPPGSPLPGIPSPQVLAKMESKDFPHLNQPLLPCRTCSFLCLGVHVKLLSKGLPGFQECCPIQGLSILFKHSWSSLASLPGREKQQRPGWPRQCPGPWHAREADPSRKAGKSLCLTSFDLD